MLKREKKKIFWKINKGTGGSKKIRRRESLWALFFLLPELIGFLIFILIPTIASLLLSLYRWDFMSPPQFVGLEHFSQLLTSSLFHLVLWNTTYYTMGTVVPSMVIGLALASVLYQKLRGRTFYRAVFFLPVIIPMVAAGLVWKLLYMPDFGLINYYLRELGLPQHEWLRSPSTAMLSIIIMSIWKGTGFSMVIYLAGLSGIPDSYYNAAKLDGANQWQQFRYITIPLLTPSTFFVLAISLIGSFQVFDQVYIMTGGGPVDSTRTIVQHMYEVGFKWFYMGRASAIAWILFIIIFSVTISQFQSQKKWVSYE